MNAVVTAIREQGIVGIIRTATPSEASASVGALIAAGLRTVEVSLVTPGAIDVIRDAAAIAPAGVHIGVGTALTPDDVRRAADAGATFVVSPILRREILTTALDLGLATLPGIATPTEALQAVEWGSTLVKLFPASLWSPAVLREVLTALPQLETVPTGGVTLDAAADWIRAGAVGLGIGGTLTRAADPAAVVRQLEMAIASAR